MKQMILIFGIVCAVATTPIFAQEPEAEEAPEPAWVGSLGLSWVATSGNTDTSSIGADFALDRKPEPWGLSLVARGTRADDQGVKTAENFLVAGRAVRALSPRWEAFAGLAWARDPFAGFDSQTVGSAGACCEATLSLPILDEDIMKRTVLVVGGGIAGMHAAAELLGQGFKVCLSEEGSPAGGWPS